ncbi:hypothetical protein H4R33_005499 [Dimargaris cristalligena]|nr:hypothetical protein H4R33_005499 [Dimargaris cristalligena]
MSAYDDLIGGSLKLKGKGGGVTKKSKKSKKSKKASHSGSSGSGRSTAKQYDQSQDGDSSQIITPAEASVAKTKAEIEFEKAQERRKMKQYSKFVEKSHPERVAEFNEKLDKLSEHYDIPKVGPG